MFRYNGFRNGKHWVFDGLGCEIAFASEDIANHFCSSDLNDCAYAKFKPLSFDKDLEEWRRKNEIPQ